MQEDIKKAKKNDKDAIEKLLKDNENVIQSKVSKYFVKGMEREDLEQEASIAFLDCIKSYDYDENDNFPAFASMCIERRLITILGSSQRQKNLALNTSYSLNHELNLGDQDSVALLDLLESDDATTEEMIIKDEQVRNITEKTKKILSKFEQDVLALYLGGHSYKEMAKELGTNEKGIDNAIQRIRAKVKGHKLL